MATREQLYSMLNKKKKYGLGVKPISLTELDQNNSDTVDLKQENPSVPPARDDSTVSDINPDQIDMAESDTFKNTPSNAPPSAPGGANEDYVIGGDNNTNESSDVVNPEAFSRTTGETITPKNLPSIEDMSKVGQDQDYDIKSQIKQAEPSPLERASVGMAGISSVVQEALARKRAAILGKEPTQEIAQIQAGQNRLEQNLASKDQLRAQLLERLDARKQARELAAQKQEDLNAYRDATVALSSRRTATGEANLEQKTKNEEDKNKFRGILAENIQNKWTKMTPYQQMQADLAQKNYSLQAGKSTSTLDSQKLDSKVTQAARNAYQPWVDQDLSQMSAADIEKTYGKLESIKPYITQPQEAGGNFNVNKLQPKDFQQYNEQKKKMDSELFKTDKDINDNRANIDMAMKMLEPGNQNAFEASLGKIRGIKSAVGGRVSNQEISMAGGNPSLYNKGATIVDRYVSGQPMSQDDVNAYKEYMKVVDFAQRNKKNKQIVQYADELDNLAPESGAAYIKGKGLTPDFANKIRDIMKEDSTNQEVQPDNNPVPIQQHISSKPAPVGNNQPVNNVQKTFKVIGTDKKEHDIPDTPENRKAVLAKGYKIIGG